MDFLSFDPPPTTATATATTTTQPEGLIHIRQSGKIRNYVRYASKYLDEHRHLDKPVVIMGANKTISMAITVAEILKRTFVNPSSSLPILHQHNTVATDGTTFVPCITIRLGWTKTSVTSNEQTAFARNIHGYQPPNEATAGCEFLRLWHLVLICKTVVVVGKKKTRLSWMFVPQSMWKLEQEADIWYTGTFGWHQKQKHPNLNKKERGKRHCKRKDWQGN